MNLSVSDLKVFLPGKDYKLSRRFYKDIGFEEVWTSPEVSEFKIGNFRFLLQSYYSKDWADNFMLSLMVDDLDAWWSHLSGKGLEAAYPGVKIKAPADYPWGLREVHLIDPSGVCWHIAQTPSA